MMDALLGLAVFADNSDFTVEIDGTTPGSGHDQLVVMGTVTIGNNVALNHSGTFVPSGGEEFIIIDNNGTGDAAMI